MHNPTLVLKTKLEEADATSLTLTPTFHLLTIYKLAHENRTMINPPIYT